MNTHDDNRPLLKTTRRHSYATLTSMRAGMAAIIVAGCIVAVLAVSSQIQHAFEPVERTTTVFRRQASTTIAQQGQLGVPFDPAVGAETDGADDDDDGDDGDGESPLGPEDPEPASGLGTETDGADDDDDDGDDDGESPLGPEDPEPASGLVTETDGADDDDDGESPLGPEDPEPASGLGAENSKAKFRASSVHQRTAL